MTDMLYEKQGSYLQGKQDQTIEIAKVLINAGKLTQEEAISLLHVSQSDLQSKSK